MQNQNRIRLVLCIVVLLCSIATEAQIYLDEDFEGSFPPTGWTRKRNAGAHWAGSSTYAFQGSRSALPGNIWEIIHRNGT